MSKRSVKSASNWLAEYSRNEYSQFGEDGILAKIFDVLPQNSNPWCVELGAWDGKYLSNAHLLLTKGDWSGVLIEGDARRFPDLCQTYEGNESVICVNEFVGFRDSESLDNVLEATRIPRQFDLLSIDVDGNDFHIWKSLIAYRPRVVVIEFNNTFPNSYEYVQPADPTINHSSSLKSLVVLGRTKGYELVCVTDFNAIFVLEEFYDLFEIEDNSPEAMNNNDRYLTYVAQLFDGTLHLVGNRRLFWHDVVIGPYRLQAIPAPLRRFPSGRNSLIWRVLIRAYKALFLRERV